MRLQPAHLCPSSRGGGIAAAKKANSLRTWKEVNAACVKAGEFKLAQASRSGDRAGAGRRAGSETGCCCCCCLPCRCAA